ncbi:hypothetical protein H6G36_17840 [Anabaena minutissima FACHB-250]|nr:hypothetical protein [Anabaena minutissima FACHB-250]
MRTYKALQKKSSAANSLGSRPFVVQPKREENTESSGTQGYASQMPEFAIFNPAGDQAPVQPKLAIGAPGDKYEQEADRTAKLVVQKINGAAIARSTLEPSIQRRSGIEEETLYDNLKVNNSLHQHTIQRFYAVKDDENAKAHATANTGRIDELNLEWIELPDPRDESEYPDTVEGTGWLYHNLYKRKGTSPVKRKQVKASVPSIGLMRPMDSPLFSIPQTGGKSGKSKTTVESLLGFAPMVPVPKGVADKQSQKAREKISNFTPQSPIQEGIKETITDRVELMKDGIQNPLGKSDSWEWTDYYIFGGGKEDLARMIDIASQKMSKDESEKFKADLDKCQFEQTIKMGAKVGFGIAASQAIGMIPHPSAKVAKFVWTATGAAALNNKMVQVSEELQNFKTAHPIGYQVMEDHRNQKMEEVYKERHRMVEVYAKSLETMGNPFA